MKILKYESRNAQFTPWTSAYLDVAKALIELIETDMLSVLHFGSTSAMVGGKGIIDLSVLYTSGQIDLATVRLKSLGFQDQISDQPFPAQRPRKDGAVVYENTKYLIHAHVIEIHSDNHIKQLAYKEHLLNDIDAREQYEATKKSILASGINELQQYGDLKSPHVKSILKKLSAI